MGTTTRRQIDATDEASAANVEALDRLTAATEQLAEQHRLGNLLAALALGNALAHDKGTRATTDDTRAKVALRNTVRAEIRAGLGIEAL